MQILVFSSYYAPESSGNAPYVTGMCEGLAALGHRVDVATGFAHYPWWKRQDRGVARTDFLNGVTVRRRFHYVPKRPTLLRRGLYEISLTAAALAGLPSTRPDLILGVVPSQADAVAALCAAVFYRRPHGLVFQDLMGPAAQQVGANGATRGSGAIARLELALARQATAVAVVADGYRGYLVEGGVESARIARVRNWAEYTSPTSTRDETRRRNGWAEDDIVCLYAGSLGYKQGLETIVDCAQHLAHPSLRIVLAGDGGERQQLVERIRAQRTRVDVLPPSAPGTYEALLEAADVLLLTQRGAVSEMSIASKLGPYLRAGRPIVGALAAGSETANELSATHAGLIVPPEDPLALATAVQAIAFDPAIRAAFGERGSAYASERLDRDRAIAGYDRFVSAVRGATSSRGALCPEARAALERV